ncbi:MAG: ABC transporter substrate-binding protein [Bdellovibrionales bacterium]|jgi:polar amino acid transport system substrate-binding protein
MKISHLVLTVLLSAAVAFSVVKVAAPTTTSAAKETAFERVMRTGVLRCGYYVFSPVTIRDPNTNVLSGFSVDMMERIAQRAGLKLEWSEEVTFANWIPALQSKRFDVVCTPMWPEITMAKAVVFTDPMFYASLSPLVRASDTRFKDDLSRLNQPDVTFLTQDGNTTDLLARETFPKAKFYTVSNMMSGGEFYQSILANKADVVLTDSNALAQFKKMNGKTLRLMDTDHPVKLQSFTLVVERNEMLLKDFLDQAIREMNNSGEIDRLLRKWEAEPGRTFLRVAQPFAKPTEK